MRNTEIALYKGNRKAGIVQSDQDSQVKILETLTPEQLDKCKRIYNQVLLYCGDFARYNEDLSLSSEDRFKRATASRAQSNQTKYLKEDGVLQARFPNQSNSSRTKSRSKKKSAKEEQQIATDNLIHDLKIQKQVVEDYLADKRLGEPEREIIKDILDEEADKHSTFEDTELILKNYLIFINQKIESLDKTSRDNDYRKRIHKTQAYKRDEKRKNESAQAIFLALGGKAPTLEQIAEYIFEEENDTKTKELLALNQYQGNIAGLIEVLVISRSEMAIGERTDNIQMMLVPIDADIEEFVAAQNPDLVLYLHPAYEESNNRYALTAFSPLNNLPVDISLDENDILSTDGFNGNRSTNPNNQLLLEQAQSNVVKAKLLSAAPDAKLLPPADSDDDSDNSSAIVLADNKDTSTLDIIPESVATLDVLETDEEVVSLTLTNPLEVLNAIIIEENFEKRNNDGWIVKSTGEVVFHSSCKNLAAKVIKSTKKIKPLFFRQLVKGDISYYDHANKTTRVFINETGETVTYEGLVKLEKFATDEEIAVDKDRVLKATIENAANIAEVTEYDGPSLQSLKNDYQLTVADAQDIIRTYENIEQNNQTRANNTVLSDEEYDTYRESKKYDPQSNVMRESDLLSVSESSVKSLKNFLKYVDDNENAKAFAIKELETLLSEISKEQAKILKTLPKEISDLISTMTHKSNEVKDIKIEITDIVTDILQKHFQCDIGKAREILALYPGVETVLDIGTESYELGNETFKLPLDIWTNEDYRYEEWNGQRDLLPFPDKQEYKKFVGFIKNIKGDDKHLKWDSFLLIMNLERALELLNSQDLEAAREFQTKIDEEAKAKAQRKIEESEDSEEVVIEELSSSTQELLNIDIQINNDIESNSETELEDLGFVDPSINISSKDLSILEEILQSKLSNKRLPLKHKMVWRKFFGSVAYEEVTTEAINEKLTKARKLLHRS